MSASVQTIDCATARKALQKFAGTLVPARTAVVLRAHLGACEDCRAAYKEALTTAAAIGETVRRERKEDQALARLERRQAELRAQRDPFERARRARPFALRLVLVPALAVVLMMFVTRVAAGPPRAEIEEWSGVVEVDDKVLANGDSAPRVVRGSWLRTANDAHLVARWGKRNVVLGSNTHVLVESNTEVRIRFAAGVVEVDGPAEVSGALGIVELPAGGRARLTLRDRVLLVEALPGERVEFIDPTGTYVIAPGHSLRRPR